MLGMKLYILFSYKIDIWKWSESESHVRLFVTPWTVQSMEFSRPEYWRYLLCDYFLVVPLPQPIVLV